MIGSDGILPYLLARKPVARVTRYQTIGFDEHYCFVVSENLDSSDCFQSLLDLTDHSVSHIHYLFSQTEKSYICFKWSIEGNN